MLSPKSDIFLKEILSYVKFTSDRDNIRTELENHISDKIEDYLEQGYDTEEAERLSISDMGNAKEIGEELNKQHNPIFGWLWQITNVILIPTIVVFGFFFCLFISSFFRSNLINEIPKSDIVYSINLKERVQIDDTVIRFTNVIYDINGNMNIFYQTYSKAIWGPVWSFGYIGEITDDLGKEYVTRSGQQNSGGIISKGVLRIHHFSEDAEMLIITYDLYNRKYRVEIPLKEGENYE
ncbi:MAG: permease prefix domain 1-containing protein [Mobilitalea sp.]